MKYVVTRTSKFYNEDPKCSGVEKEMVIRKKELVEAYTIKLDSLEDLHQLEKEVKHPIIVFTKSDWGFELPELEIYDSYRESN